MAAPGWMVALVGAESTGKTTLAFELAQALRTDATDGERSVAVVDEYLREFCDQQGRTPQRSEQAGIAAEQTRRIAAAAACHAIVIADTTALMTAVYSDHIFNDHSLYAPAAVQHRATHLTLLTAMDLPWQADGLQRTGAHVRQPVDDLLRAVLRRERISHAVVAGQGPARLDAALRAVQHALARRGHGFVKPAALPCVITPRWQWRCERCGDAACERRLFKSWIQAVDPLAPP